MSLSPFYRSEDLQIFILYFGHHLIFQGEEKCCKLFQPLFQKAQHFSHFLLRKVCPTLVFPTFLSQFFQQPIVQLSRLMLLLHFFVRQVTIIMGDPCLMVPCLDHFEIRVSYKL